MRIIKKYLSPDGPIQQQEPVLLKKRHGLWWHMMHPIRKRLYNNIGPYLYHGKDAGINNHKPTTRIFNALFRNKKDYFREKDGIVPSVKNALWAKYLRLDDEDAGFNISDYVEESPYEYNGHKAYRLKPNVAFTEYTPLYWDNLDAVLNPNEVNYGIYNSTDLEDNANSYDRNLGRYDYGRTSDYTWYHDKWDLNPYHGKAKDVNNLFYDINTNKKMRDPDTFYTALALGMSERKFRRMRRKRGSDWVNQLLDDRGIDLWDSVLSKEYGKDFELRPKKWSLNNIFKRFGDLSFGIGRPFHLYDRYYTNE